MIRPNDLPEVVQQTADDPEVLETTTAIAELVAATPDSPPPPHPFTYSRMSFEEFRCDVMRSLAESRSNAVQYEEHAIHPTALAELEQLYEKHHLKALYNLIGILMVNRACEEAGGDVSCLFPEQWRGGREGKWLDTEEFLGIVGRDSSQEEDD